jgi:hypothetical protein
LERGEANIARIGHELSAADALIAHLGNGFSSCKRADGFPR